MKKLIFLVFCYNTALFALPSGGQVVQGEAAIISSPNRLHIQAEGSAILHWEQFDIASHEAVFFTQLLETRAILNRVPSGLPSQILGRLEANCPIYLVNPQGVFLGSSAVVETAGFLASTSDLSNTCFLNQEPLLFEQLGDGCIVNLGKIQSVNGDVILIARSIDNQGSIDAPNSLVLFATNEVMLHPGTKETAFIRYEAQEGGGIHHSGSIQALAVEFKTESPYAKAIHIEGVIEATNVAHVDGRVYLVADQGGCFLNGSIQAAAGSIEIKASFVHATENSVLDVSSNFQGGTVQIEPERLYADCGARFLANANIEGNGGTIALLADQQLSFYGEAYVCGGNEGGNGGMIHLSSRGPLFQLDPHRPILVASAPQGHSGKIFFDPKNVTISSDGMDSATGNTFAFNPADSVFISGTALSAALDAANVIIQANTDIFFLDAVEAMAMGNSLTLQAGRSIQMGGTLVLNAGDFIATINDAGAMPSDRDAGIASFNIFDGASVTTQGGDIFIDVGMYGGVQEGEMYLSGILDAGGGDISIRGFARQDSTDTVFGITSGFGAIVQTTGAGTLSLLGTGGTGVNYNAGIYLGAGLFQTDAGLLQMTGTGGGNGLGNGNVGIYSSAQIATISTGNIVLDGVGGNGIHGNIGVLLGMGTIHTVAGDIALQGTGNGTGALNFGVRFESNSHCLSSGTGAISFTGISGNGKNNNHGVILSGGTISTDSGPISITGTGRGSVSYNYGIRMESNSTISTGTGTITLDGQNTSGTSGNAGVSIAVSDAAITSGYGDIQVTGTSTGTTFLNQGVRLESGQIISTGTGAGSANIHLTGVGSLGTDFCNGIAVQGIGEAMGMTFYGTVITSIDGNIILEGTSQGSGQGNQALDIDPASLIQTTGSGIITYIEH